MVNVNLKLRLQPHPCKKKKIKPKSYTNTLQLHRGYNSLNTINESGSWTMCTQATKPYINRDPNKKNLHLREVLKKCRSLQSLHSHQWVFPLDCLPSIVDLKITFYFCFKPCLVHNHAVGSFQYHTKMLENKLFFSAQRCWTRVLTTAHKNKIGYHT